MTETVYTKSDVGLTLDNWNPYAAAVGDVNRDMGTDLVFFSQSQDSGMDTPILEIGYRTSADGAAPTYRWETVPVTSGRVGQGLVVLDLDADGKTEILMTSFENANLVSYEWDEVSGTIQAEPVMTPGSISGREVRVADLDDDGHLDLIWRSGTASGIGILWGS